MNLQHTAWESARHTLTYDEFKSGTHTEIQIGRSPRWIPAFVANEFQFRSVLMQAVAQFAFGVNRTMPTEVCADLGYLRALAADTFTRECLGWDDGILPVMIGHIEAVKKCGGYLHFVAALMYRAWKLQWHSRELAEELGLPRKAVDRQLVRLVIVAEKLGYPTYPKRKGCLVRKRKRKKENRYGTPAMRASHIRANAKYYHANKTKVKERRELKAFLKTVAWG